MSEPSGDAIGLCASCRHARTVRTPRSVFWRCTLAETDARFVRYPRLPMLVCDGYERDPSGRAGTDSERTKR